MEKFLERYSYEHPLKKKQKYYLLKRIIVVNFPTKKIPGTNSFTDHFFQTFNEKN